MTALTRRAFAAGAATLAMVPAAPTRAQALASRSFRFMLDGRPVGTHVVSVRRGAQGVSATSDIDVVVKGLGIITLYRYTLTCTETYDAEGNLVSMNGTCDDDGDANFVTVSRQGGELLVQGSSYTGPSPLAAVPASYWWRGSLNRTPWISTQSGLQLPISVSPVASADAPSGATAYRATNGTDFTIDLFYDARGEWIGSAFDAKGRRATMEYVSETGALQA